MQAPLAHRRSDLAEMLGGIGGGWVWLLVVAAATVILGLIAIVESHATLLVVAVIFGLQLVLSGLFSFASVFSLPEERGWQRALMGLVALFSILVGVYLVAHPLLSVLVLAFLLGLYWITSGLVELFVSIEHSELPGRIWAIAGGLLSIFAGLVVLFNPVITLLFLTVFLGAWLVLRGVLLALAALRLRSLAR